MEEQIFATKLLLVGEGNVGKTSLLLRYVDNTFTDPNPEFEFKLRMLDIDHRRVKVVLCDTAGQENFRTLTGGMYHGVSGVLVVYDMTQMDSFTLMGKWVEGIKKYIPQKDVVLIIVGNKAKVVPTDMAKKFATDQGTVLYETSAKTGENVEAAFDYVVRAIVEKQFPSKKGKKKPAGGAAPSGSSDSGSGCCTLL